MKVVLKVLLDTGNSAEKSQSSHISRFSYGVMQRALDSAKHSVQYKVCNSSTRKYWPTVSREIGSRLRRTSQCSGRLHKACPKHRVRRLFWKRRENWYGVENIYSHDTIVRDLQASKRSIKILLKDLVPQLAEKKREGSKALFSSLEVKPLELHELYKSWFRNYVPRRHLSSTLFARTQRGVGSEGEKNSNC